MSHLYCPRYPTQLHKSDMPRELDDDLQYDIDEAILDYLLYTSTELLLDYSSKCETEFVQNAIDEHDRYIQMVDCTNQFIFRFILKNHLLTI